VVAARPREDLLTPAPVLSSAERARGISRVLLQVFGLNLLVAVAKIGFGLWSGAVSIFSDGLHSLTDSASNVVAMIGTRVARRPADISHPYGHRKFETLAAAAILVFLILVLLELIRQTVGRLASGGAPDVTAASFIVMIGTLAINIGVARYEMAAGRRLRSEVLRADAHHTRSDVYTSVAVIGALTGVWWGYPLLDPLAALLVAVFIGKAAWEIARETSGVLADQVVLDTAAIERVVHSVDGVLGCHEIRTRGSADHAFLDLHVWFAPDSRLDEAHRLSHEVKDRLQQEFPQLADVVIHLEPPPKVNLE
jgi:cation diffusion facilitator family transporter